jgi:hypothetical protein
LIYDSGMQNFFSGGGGGGGGWKAKAGITALFFGGGGLPKKYGDGSDGCGLRI